MEEYDDSFIDQEEADATEESEKLNLTDESFADLLIQPADWTIETIFSQIGKQIDLDPAFQRRNVWAASAKSRFIESLFLGIPIPQILLTNKEGQRNSFLVLDGKQRLLTIKEFLDGKHSNGRRFRLKNLRVLHDLENKDWDEIRQESDWEERLLNNTQRAAVIRGWKKEEILYEIFYRINSGSVKLSPMELRMSLHPGDFLKYIIQWTENISAIHSLLGKKTPDPRMNDVELAVRFLGFARNEIAYRGDLKAFLDETCNTLNKLFEAEQSAEQVVTGQLSEMLAGIEVGLDALGREKFCRKYTDGQYQNRFNRAVFDVQVGALSDPRVRKIVSGNPTSFEEAFLAASEDTAFVKSVESTTKTSQATRTRFEVFYHFIEKHLDVDMRVPSIEDVR